jgi:hypothetical protein
MRTRRRDIHENMTIGGKEGIGQRIENSGIEE